MLERLRDRMIREEGYTLDEETGWVPPGRFAFSAAMLGTDARKSDCYGHEK